MTLQTLKKMRCHELEIDRAFGVVAYTWRLGGIDRGSKEHMWVACSERLSSMADKPLPSDLPLMVTKDLLP